MLKEVSKIGTGTENDPFPFRPDTATEHWQVVEEREDSFLIEVFN